MSLIISYDVYGVADHLVATAVLVLSQVAMLKYTVLEKVTTKAQLFDRCHLLQKREMPAVFL